MNTDINYDDMRFVRRKINKDNTVQINEYTYCLKQFYKQNPSASKTLNLAYDPKRTNIIWAFSGKTIHGLIFKSEH